MKTARPNFKSVDDYIKSFTGEQKKKLVEMRSIIRKLVPEAEERLSYQMPAFFLNGVVVWYAAHANHIGLYPTASGIREFEPKLKKYVHSKGAIQFPIDKPLPKMLIREIVRFRLRENMMKVKRS